MASKHHTTQGNIRHTEYLRAAILGLPFLDSKTKPVSFAEAMYEGHLRALPKERHVSLQAMQTRNSSGKFTRIFKEARDIVKNGKGLDDDAVNVNTERKKPSPRMPVHKGPNDHRAGTLKGLPTESDLAAQDAAEGIKGARWETPETALVAREVMRQVANGNKLPPPRIVHAVQREVLPRERWRKYAGIAQSHFGAHILVRNLEAAFKWGTENVPGYLHPGPLPAEVVQAVLRPVKAHRAALHMPHATTTADKPAQAQEAPPVQVLEMVVRGKTPPARVSASAAPSAVAAGSPEQHPFAQASAAFAVTITNAVDALLQAHAAHLMGDIENRLASIANAVGVSVAHQIEAGLRSTVMATLAHELGGPISPPPQQLQATPEESPPAVPQPAPQAPAKQYGQSRPSEPQRPVLVADVVGLIGSQITEVKGALNGRADLRFVDADQITAWIPREKAEVFMATKFVSHSVERRCNAFHVKPHRVNGGVTSMVLALESAYREIAGDSEMLTH